MTVRRPSPSLTISLPHIPEPLRRDSTSQPAHQCSPSTLGTFATGDKLPLRLDGALWLPDTLQRSPRRPSTASWVMVARHSAKMAAQWMEVIPMELPDQCAMDGRDLEAAFRQLLVEHHWPLPLAGQAASARSSRA